MKSEAIYFLKSGQNLWEPDGTMLQVLYVDILAGRVQTMVESGGDSGRSREYQRGKTLERLRLRMPRRAANSAARETR